MKARPRGVERAVAAELSRWFAKYNLPPVQRIPVLGREGPDLSWNAAKLIVDVKSRKNNPKYLRSPYPLVAGKLLGVPLNLLDVLVHGFPHPSVKTVKASFVLDKYFIHQDLWTKEHVPDGLTGIILHWPHQRISKAMLYIEAKKYEHFAYLAHQ